jgi:predicted transcriptional regulator
MNPGRTVRSARRRSHLTQRDLARRTGIAQPTIARIERGQEDPRVGTLVRLLDACDEELRVSPARGRGVDLSTIRAVLARTPAQRIRDLVDEAAVMETIALARPVR